MVFPQISYVFNAGFVCVFRYLFASLSGPSILKDISLSGRLSGSELEQFLNCHRAMNLTYVKSLARYALKPIE